MAPASRGNFSSSRHYTAHNIRIKEGAMRRRRVRDKEWAMRRRRVRDKEWAMRRRRVRDKGIRRRGQ